VPGARCAPLLPRLIERVEVFLAFFAERVEALFQLEPPRLPLFIGKLTWNVERFTVNE
jgi:hypothetical protein